MKKILTTILFALCIAITTKAQTVCPVKNALDADIKVYVVQDSSTADLVVYKDTTATGVGANNGTWYFTHFADQAQKRIFFDRNPADADLNIFFTSNPLGAVWINTAKQGLMN